MFPVVELKVVIVPVIVLRVVIVPVVLFSVVITAVSEVRFVRASSSATSDVILIKPKYPFDVESIYYNKYNT